MPDDATGNGLRGRDLAGLGGFLVGAVVAGLALGLFIDDRAGTEPVFSLVGVFVGILLAVLGFALRVRAALRDPDPGD